MLLTLTLYSLSKNT